MEGQICLPFGPLAIINADGAIKIYLNYGK